MCAPVLIPLVGAALSAGSQIYSANRAERNAKRDQAEQQALRDQQAAQRTQMEGSFNNIDEAAGGAPSGLGNTFLTGAGGIANSQLNLGNGVGTNRTLGS